MSDQKQIRQAIEALEKQREALGDALVDTTIASLRAQLRDLDESAIQLTGERKFVTVMFADIAGFTQLSERNDPEAVRALMNGCFDHLVPVVHEYRGTVDKFIGDEIMAIFGAPKAHERHAELGCMAALDMFASLKLFNEKNNTDLALHIGLNSGLVIAGGIGSQGRQEYSVMGDAVNLAARLKDAAPEGEIFVGPDVHAMVGQLFHFQTLPPMRLKGKAELVHVYRLKDRKEAPVTRTEGILTSDLIGREAELAKLQEIADSAASRKGHRIAIIAEAGIGKSRLVAEARQSLETALTWIEGRALPYTRQHGYQPAVEVMTKLIGAPSHAEGGILKKHLEDGLEEVLGEQGEKHLPFLARMMQLPLNEEEEISVKYLNPEALRDKIFGAFTQYLSARADREPIVLVWEDLHWADPSSLALIEHLMPLSDSRPISMLLTFRPHKDERIWQFHQKSTDKFDSGYRILHLEPLTASGSSALIRNLMRAQALAPEVEQMIAAKAEGNPFYVEELLRSLLDKGILSLKGQMKPSGLIELPGTLQGVIASRIDNLDPHDKRVLQTASILGRIFHSDILDTLLSQTDVHNGNDNALDRLVERDLIRRRTEEEDRRGYIFKHALTHEVAYQNLLISDRRQLHTLAGRTIEDRAGKDTGDVAEILAFHFEKAGQSEKAIHYLRMAADRAKKTHSNEEAIQLYQRALNQVSEAENGRNPDQSALLESLADVLALTGRHEDAKSTYLKAMHNLGENELFHRAGLHRKIGQCMLVASKFDTILEHYDEAEAILSQWRGEKPQQWWREWLDLKLHRITIYYWLDRTDLMKSLSGKLRDAVKRHGNVTQQAQYFQNLLLMHIRTEQYFVSAETVDLGRQLVEAFEKTDDLRQIAMAKFMYGFALLWHNSLESSLAPMEESARITERTGDIVWQTRNLAYLAISHRRMNDTVKTSSYTLHSLKLAEACGMAEYIGTAHANLTWLSWKSGRYEEVEIHARQALEYWKKVPGVHSVFIFIWTLAWPLAALYHEQGNLAKCVSQFEEMLKPGRKRMEDELEEAMRDVISSYGDENEKSMRERIAAVLEMAEHYKYL